MRVEPSAGSDNGRMDECASSLTKRHESYPFMYECSVIGLYVVSRLKKQLLIRYSSIINDGATRTKAGGPKSQCVVPIASRPISSEYTLTTHVGTSGQCSFYKSDIFIFFTKTPTQTRHDDDPVLLIHVPVFWVAESRTRSATRGFAWRTVLSFKL